MKRERKINCEMERRAQLWTLRGGHVEEKGAWGRDMCTHVSNTDQGGDRYGCVWQPRVAAAPVTPGPLSPSALPRRHSVLEEGARVQAAAGLTHPAGADIKGFSCTDLDWVHRARKSLCGEGCHRRHRGQAQKFAAPRIVAEPHHCP